MKYDMEIAVSLPYPSLLIAVPCVSPVPLPTAFGPLTRRQ